LRYESRDSYRKTGGPVNIRLSLHNVLLITAVAVLGILLLRMASKTGLRDVPVVGQVFATAATA
jgi:hypothetical protein